VYDVGETDGFAYIAFELVEGENLRRWQDGQPTDPRTAAAVVARVAAAIQHAHEQGIVHRDLKPANILLAQHAESGSHSAAPSSVSRAAGSSVNTAPRPPHSELQPKVTDFGLAKSLEGGADLTVTGIACGTPNYMAPEQVRGGKRVGPAVDVYGLGAVLYELLTGKPPFGGTDAAEVMDRIVRTDPTPVRRMNPKVPRDLQVVVAKCLEKDPGRRYLTARDVADDLDRFLAGRPIVARAISTTERAWRWCRRNPVVTAFLLLMTVGCIATGSLAAALARSEAVERAARADAVEAQLAAQRTGDQLRVALEKADAARHTATVERAAAEKARDDLRAALDTVKAEKAAADQERRRAVDTLRLSRSVIRNALEQCANHPRFKEPEFRELRDKLIRSTTAFSKKVAAQGANDPEWLADLGDMAHWVGFLEYLNGDMTAAAANYLDAAAAFRRWAAADADDPEPRVRESFALTNAANAHYHAGKWPEAEARHRESIGLLATAVKEHPTVEIYAARLVRAHAPLYEMLREQKRWADGLAVCRECLPRARDLVGRFGEKPEYVTLLASALQTLGQMLDRTGSPADAEDQFTEAVRLREDLAAKSGWVVGLTAAAARTWHSVADHHVINGHADRAGQPLARAAALIEEVNRVAPGVPEFVLQLVDVATMQGELLRAAGEFKQAEPRYDLAVTRVEDLLKRNPDPAAVRQLRTAWAAAVTGRAHLYNHLHRHTDAAAEWDRLAKDDPDVSVRLRHSIFVLHSHNFGKDWRKAMAGAEKLTAGNPHPGAVAELGRVWCNISKLAADDDKGTSEKALAQAIRCLELAKAGGVFRQPGAAERFAADKDFDPVRAKFDPRD
jgi:tetratricopeptide (TPR) repeat protein